MPVAGRPKAPAAGTSMLELAPTGPWMPPVPSRVSRIRVGVSGMSSPRVTWGMTALEGAEGGPVPVTSDAVTVNVYDVPLSSPGSGDDVAGPETVADAPP